MRGECQTTIADVVSIKGIGVHTSEKVSTLLIPADENTGIVFYSKDLQTKIPAKWNHVATNNI